MATPPGIVWLYEETAQAFLGPVLVLVYIVGTVNVAQQHDGAERLEPVISKAVHGEGVHHGVSVSAFDFPIQLVTQVRQQQPRQLVPRHKGDDGGHRLTISQRHLTGHNVGRQSRAIRVREWRLTRDPMDGGASRIVHNGRHFGGIPGRVRANNNAGSPRSSVYTVWCLDYLLFLLQFAFRPLVHRARLLSHNQRRRSMYKRKKRRKKEEKKNRRKGRKRKARLVTDVKLLGSNHRYMRALCKLWRRLGQLDMELESARPGNCVMQHGRRHGRRQRTAEDASTPTARHSAITQALFVRTYVHCGTSGPGVLRCSS